MSKSTKWLFVMLMAAFLLIPSVSQAAQTLEPIHPAINAQIKRLEREVAVEGHTFSVGYSSAMEKTIDELCGMREPLGWMDHAQALTASAPSLQATTFPASYDWRTLGGATPIKDQGNCGSCWAFGTVAPLEAQIKILNGLTVDLSEQYLISCNTNGWGCNGGWWAHNYHTSIVPPGETSAGAVLESGDPYQATDTACNGPHNHPYKIASWAYVIGQPLPSVQAIKQAIYTYGPIGAAVYVGPKWQAYTGGIFNANESGQVNHAIALVGWVDDIGPDNGYWILRNSWGTSWGESGYMRIRYGCNQVGYSANYVELSSITPPQPPPPPPAPTTPLPDLTGSYSGLTTFFNGRQVSGTLKVTNSGQVNAGSFKVFVYASHDGVSKDTLLGTKTITALKTKAYTYVAFKKTMTSGTFSGQYVLALIDADGQVKESDESNNNISKLIP